MQDEAEAPKGAGYLKVPLLRYETPVCARGAPTWPGGARSCLAPSCAMLRSSPWL